MTELSIANGELYIFAYRITKNARPKAKLSLLREMENPTQPKVAEGRTNIEDDYREPIPMPKTELTLQKETEKLRSAKVAELLGRRPG